MHGGTGLITLDELLDNARRHVADADGVVELIDAGEREFTIRPTQGHVDKALAHGADAQPELHVFRQQPLAAAKRQGVWLFDKKRIDALARARVQRSSKFRQPHRA